MANKREPSEPSSIVTSESLLTRLNKKVCGTGKGSRTCLYMADSSRRRIDGAYITRMFSTQNTVSPYHRPVFNPRIAAGILPGGGVHRDDHPPAGVPSHLRHRAAWRRGMAADARAALRGVRRRGAQETARPKDRGKPQAPARLMPRESSGWERARGLCYCGASSEAVAAVAGALP